MKARGRRWTPGELKLLKRHVRLLLADRSLSAFEVAGECACELRRARGPGAPARTRHAAYGRICDELRAAGRGRTACRDRWTMAERALLERYARDTVSGRYRSTRKAAVDCWEEIRKLEPGRDRFVDRSRVGVYGRLSARVFELGGSSARAAWSPAEERVLVCFARRVVAGRYVTCRSALPELCSELARYRRRVGPGRRRTGPPRTARAVLLRLQQAVRGLDPGRPTLSERRWSQAETGILDRFARRVGNGRYPDIAAASPDCTRALDRYRQRAKRRVVRTEAAVRRALAARANAIGLVLRGRAWTREEDQVVDRYARAVASGRIPSAVAAAERCAADINRRRERHPERYPDRVRRTVDAVHGRLWPRVAQWRYPWRHTRWTEAERRVVERYARAALAHEHPSLLAAARACHAELAEVVRPAGGKAVPVRPVHAVRDMLVKCTRRHDWRQLPYRRWDPAEHRVGRRWTRRYILHRQGKLVANLVTLAGMLKADLDRHGYYRGLQACKMYLITAWSGSRQVIPRPGRPA